MTIASFTLDERIAIGRAFDRGNYANAYESTNLDAFDLDDMTTNERAAFVLGFFSSHELSEISDREIFDECYRSATGQYVVNAGYCDRRECEAA